MSDIFDETVNLVVTSPPYNIDINYGNHVSNGKIINSKSVKYKDDLPEVEYRKLLNSVFSECKRVLKKRWFDFCEYKK